jgi:ABC-type antimicrobial peptide transport system permease subunit
MLKNYFILNLRTLWKNRSHTIVNIVGLSLGITCSIVIFLIVRFELSFDKYHAKGERIYRIATEYTKSDPHGYNAGVTYPLPETLRQDFADLEYVSITDSNMSDPVISVTKDDGTEERFKEAKVTFADPEFFKIFNYEWIEGNPEALQKEKTVVLTATVAKKYFGNEPALGRVSGVTNDPPLNSSLPFRIIFSAKLGADKRGWEDWGSTSSSINCYVLLNEAVSREAFEAKLEGWHLKYFTGDNEDDGKYRRYFLQPLHDIHYNTNFNNYADRVVSSETILAISLIGLLLLGTACINFINLNTVLIINRTKEAGIRKVLGSSRLRLVTQFLGDTFLITFIATVISVCLVELVLINMRPVLGYRLDFYPLRDIITILFLISLPVIVTLLAGLYPAISLASFQPVTALKNKLTNSFKEGITLRRSLIVFQLIISQVLVVFTIVIIQQINSFMKTPMGLNSEAIIEFGLPENKVKQLRLLKERLLTIPGVQNVSMSNTGANSGNRWSGEVNAKVNNQLVKESADVKFADEDYVETYQLKLLHGEDLIRSDTANRFLVNESLTRKLGYEQPEEAIGTEIEIWGNRALVTGIVNDFNTQSLHTDLNPTIIMSAPGAFYVGAVKLNTTETNKVIDEVQNTWEQFYPKFVFEYKFLDDTIAEYYEAERRNSYLMSIFAGIAILIGCIGLFGLVSFMARQKTKEIGIRKTLGASVQQVIGLFSKEFFKLILISFAISVPVAYYVMEQWLANFAYRINPGIVTFLLGVGVTIFVVLLTVGIKSYNAAVSNPVDALRDE